MSAQIQVTQNSDFKGIHGEHTRDSNCDERIERD